MNSFQYHVPRFIDIPQPPDLLFETLSELMQNKSFDGWRTTPKFSQFVLSDNYIMALLDDGFEWYVVGSICDVSDINLPKWNGGKYRAKLADGTETVLGKADVMSSCGNILTLYDGTIATNLRP